MAEAEREGELSGELWLGLDSLVGLFCWLRCCGGCCARSQWVDEEEVAVLLCWLYW